jgi:hypothetical protein
MNEKKIKRVLVVCPLSIMTSAWKNDIYNTCVHRVPGVAYGTADQRRLIIDNPQYEFVIINYDGVNIVKDAIKEANFDLVVIDEANAYKTVTTARWKTLAKILRPETRLWMLTGTPASQSPVDAYGLARLVCPDRVPKFSSAWRDIVMKQLTRFKWVPKPGSETKVFNTLQPAIRFAKNDCLDLPDVMYQTRIVPLTKQVETYYNKLKKDFLIEAAGEEISSVNAAANMTIIKEFQNAEDPRVLVIQPQAASHGVTLTRADTVVFWSPVMSVETYVQCIARIERVGQKNNMTVVHLQGSEIEKRMYDMLQRKVDAHTSLVNLYREEIGI